MRDIRNPYYNVYRPDPDAFVAAIEAIAKACPRPSETIAAIRAAFDRLPSEAKR